jgi:hypothetical protein
MKVLDIITETTPSNPRVLSDDEIMNALREAIKKDPNGVKSLANAELVKGMGITEKSRFYAAEAEMALNTRWGFLTGWIKFAGFAVPAYDWYSKMLALNNLAKEKDASGEYKYSDGVLQNTRNEITAVFVVSQLLPLIAKSITSATVGTLVKELFKTVASNTLGKGGGWAIFLAKVLTTAGWALFSIWLSSPAGTEWIKSIIPGIILNGVGALVNWPIDWLTNKIHDTTGVNVRPDPDVQDRLKTTPDLEQPNYDPEKVRAQRRPANKIVPSDYTTNAHY